MAKALFPILNPSSIHQMLVEEFRTDSATDFRPDLADIASPKSASMPRLYSEIFALIVGCQMELEPTFEATNELEYPELYKDCTPKLMFLRGMKKLMKYMAIDDFGIADILSPDRKRTLYILSGVVNYLMFKKHYDRKLDTAEKRLDEIDAQKAAATTHLVALQEKVDKSRQRVAEVNSQKLEFATKSEELVEEVAALDTQGCSLTKRKEELKGKVQEAQSAEATAMVELATVNERLSQLESQIVEPPDQLKAKKEMLIESNHELFVQIQQAQEEAGKKRISISFMEETTQIMEKFMALLTRKGGYQEEICQLQKEIEKFHYQKVECKQEMKRQIADEELCKRKLDMLVAKKAQLTKQIEMRSMAHNSELDRFATEKKKLVELTTSNKKLLEMMEAEEQKIRQEMERCREQHKQAIENLVLKARDMLHTVDQRVAELEHNEESQRNKMLLFMEQEM